MVETVYCVHCGAVAKHPVTKTINGQSLSFCCGGCLQVYELMHEEGLLSNQGEQTVTKIFRLEEAHPAAKQLNESAHPQTIFLHVTGMTCANCVATVERHLLSVPGVMDVSVVLETERATVKMIPGRISMADLMHAVEKAGYEISPEGNS
jgi:P-type Cu2+ transporter